MHARRSAILRFIMRPLNIVAAGAVLALIVLAAVGPAFPVLGQEVKWALAGLAGGVLLSVIAASHAAGRAPKGEEIHRILTTHAGDALVHLGSDGRVLFASPASAQVLRRSPDEICHHSITEFVVGAGRADVQGALARTSYFGVETAVDFRVRGRHGGLHWVEMRCRPLLPQQRRPQKAASAFEAVAVIRDITARKDAEAVLCTERDRAQAENQAKSWFLANMSHELRTPLNAIIGFSEMMMSEIFGPLGNARYLDYAGHVKESGEHLRDLINDVLDVSKIEAGRFHIDLERVSVPKVIEETLQTVSVSAKKKNVALDVDFPVDLPRVTADRRAIKQIFLNLLANAIKFTPEGGTVTAAAHADDSSMFIEVRDTGVGIPDGALSRLGQPFEQIARAPMAGTDGRADKGTGLGLALVNAFAGLHGGTFELESKEGEGTCARVQLPLQGPKGKGDEAGQGPSAAIDLASRRVA